jgi:maleamate amidohydrolase
VRATAVDALQHGYRVVVPREAVGDRNPPRTTRTSTTSTPKYGDVLPVRDVHAFLASRERLETGVVS